MYIVNGGEMNKHVQLVCSLDACRLRSFRTLATAPAVINISGSRTS